MMYIKKSQMNLFYFSKKLLEFSLVKLVKHPVGMYRDLSSNLMMATHKCNSAIYMAFQPNQSYYDNANIIALNRLKDSFE